jgi:hypothetical protein
MVADRQRRADRNTRSATYSNFSAFGRLLNFIERNESTQLSIRQMAAMPVTLSIIVADPNLLTLIEVMIIRQKPRRLADVFRICGDLFSGIMNSVFKNIIRRFACTLLLFI